MPHIESSGEKTLQPLPALVSTHKWLVTLTVMTGTTMSTLDTSIVNVAMPHIQGNLGASVEEITWVATAYILSSVIMMPLIALMSSRFGRKKFYMFSVVIFVVSSMLCGMARSLPTLVAFRVIQGIGGGTLIPVSQAILRETFPIEEQGMAMGIYGLGVILGPTCGPLLGGWLTDNYSWPWIFYINVPVCIVNILMVMRFIHDPSYLVREKGKMDWSGLAFMIIGLGSLQVMLEEGQRKEWFESSLIVWMAVIATVGLILFIWRELTTDKPAVDLRILRNVTFASGTAIGAILGMGLYSSIFILPLFLQQLMGYPALNAGMTLIPRSLAMSLIFPLAGRMYNRVGPRRMIFAGLLIGIYSFWELSRLSLDVSYWNIFFPQFLQGIGFGFIFVSLSTAALSTIERPQMTAATGLYNVIRQVFGSIGLAIAATEISSGLTRNRAFLVNHISNLNQTATSQIAFIRSAIATRIADPVAAQQMTLNIMDHRIMQQAGMLSYNHVFYLVTILFIFALPFVVLLRGARPMVGVPKALGS